MCLVQFEPDSAEFIEVGRQGTSEKDRNTVVFWIFDAKDIMLSSTIAAGVTSIFSLSRFTLSPMKTWRSTASTSFCTPPGILEEWFGTWSMLAGLTGFWCTCWEASGGFVLLTPLLCHQLHSKASSAYGKFACLEIQATRLVCLFASRLQDAVSLVSLFHMVHPHSQSAQEAATLQASGTDLLKVGKCTTLNRGTADA